MTATRTEGGMHGVSPLEGAVALLADAFERTAIDFSELAALPPVCATPTPALIVRRHLHVPGPDDGPAYVYVPVDMPTLADFLAGWAVVGVW